MIYTARKLRKKSNLISIFGTVYCETDTKCNFAPSISDHTEKETSYPQLSGLKVHVMYMCDSV